MASLPKGILGLVKSSMGKAVVGVGKKIEENEQKQVLLRSMLNKINSVQPQQRLPRPQVRPMLSNTEAVKNFLVGSVGEATKTATGAVIPTTRAGNIGGKAAQSYLSFSKGFAQTVAKTPQIIGRIAQEQGERGTTGTIPTLGPISMLTGVGNVKLPFAKKRQEEQNKKMSEWGKQLVSANEKWIKRVELDPQSEDNLWAYQFGSGAASLGEAIGLTVATGSPAPAATLFGLQTKGQVYGEAREAGIDPQKASLISTGAGVTEGILEYVGIDKFMNPVAKGMLGKMISRGITEGVQEGLQEFSTNAWAKIGYERQRNLMQGVFESVIVGGVLGLAGGTGDAIIDVQEKLELKQLAKESGLSEKEASYFANKLIPQLASQLKVGYQKALDYVNEAQPLALSIKDVSRGENISPERDVLRDKIKNLSQQLKDTHPPASQPGQPIQEKVNMEEEAKDLDAVARVLEQPEVSKYDLQQAQKIVDRIEEERQITQKTEDEITIQKLNDWLRSAEPARKKTEALYSQERGKRFGEIRNIPQEVRGEERYFTKLGKMKGALPRADFQVSEQVGDEQINRLYDIVEKNPTFDEGTKLTAQHGLQSLLREQKVPTTKELVLLKQVFGEEFVTNIKEASQTPLGRVKLAVLEILNAPRAIMASGELSGTLRQGLVAVAYKPSLLPRMIGKQFKAVFSQNYVDNFYQNLQKNSWHNTMINSGLDIVGEKSKVGGLETREEQFMGEAIQKIPGLGHIIKMSERGYVLGLDHLRTEIFKSLGTQMVSEGISPQNNQKAFDDLSTFINTSTGRGKLPAKIEATSAILNGVLFSPRLLSSRLQVMNPKYYSGLHPTVRKEALKAMFRMIGFGLTVLGIAKLGGAEVEGDPRSSDFGKIKIGKTRWDIWGGHQQVIRTLAQFLTGEYKSTKTGFVTKYGEGYPPRSRIDPLISFFEGKLSPQVSFVYNLLRGENWLGEPFELKRELGQRLVPMYWKDLNDAYKEMGPSALFSVGIPGMFGVGIQTYTPTDEERIREKIKNKTLSKQEWKDAVEKGVVSKKPSEQMKFIKEAKLPSDVVAFSKMSSKKQVEMMYKLPPEQRKKYYPYLNKNYRDYLKK